MRSISVIIPFYNAGRYLNHLLIALENQKRVDTYVEVLLIDNGSNDNSSDIINNFIQKPRNFEYKYYLYDEKAGSYAARNFGVKLSQNEVLVFTDSDCIPRYDWLYSIAVNIQEGVIISGNIDLVVEDNKNVWEVFDKFAHLTNDKNAAKNKVATANMSVLKEDFMRVGYFYETYSGGDHDWSIRASQIELHIKYYGSIIVEHPTRKSFQEILKKNLRIAYGRGNKYRMDNRKLYSIVVLYILKVFNIRINFKYSKRLWEHDFDTLEIIQFNFKFMELRILQINAAIKGFKGIEVRSSGIK